MSNNSKIKIDNLELIQKELDALEQIIKTRIKAYFDQSDENLKFELPSINEYDSEYSNFLKKHELIEAERIIFLLALSREVYPQILDPFLTKNSLYDLKFTEFGGVSNDINNSFIPTLQTALFLICGDNRLKIVSTLNLLANRGKIFKVNIFKNHDSKNIIDRPLNLSNAAVNSFLNEGNAKAVTYARDFPATLLKTEQSWSDLVVSKFTEEHLEELDTWLSHHEELLDDWGMAKFIKPGYKALFYGPPGTGKSLTATLLAKKINKVVYRIDLSQVVSKYIGETEKNLEKVFQQAEDEEWVLFFDEADSIFGKRTEVSSSNDKHANQETSYLLQRIDECKNMVILASNLKDNFDEAFLRRFQSIIYFPLPNKAERLRLWKNGFSQKAILDEVDLEEISYDFEVSGATIMNVIRYASLMAIKEKTEVIKQSDIIKGIRREKFKEGKLV